jgi:hypothetical protein
VKCENALLEILGYKVLIPTTSEILKLLLHLSNPVQDFAEIVNKTKEFIFKALLDYELSFYLPSSISLAALLLSLDALDYVNF